jgi:hypothetical protein
MDEKPDSMVIVKVDTRRIHDWATYHDTFAETFGFPSFYGRNMDAWIDCLTWLDDPTCDMTKIHAPPGGVVVLELEYVDEFFSRCPEQYAATIECAAFVNWRKIEIGERAVLALSYYKRS